MHSATDTADHFVRRKVGSFYNKLTFSSRRSKKIQISKVNQKRMELLTQFAIAIGAACLPECYSNFNLVRTGCAVCVITRLETQAGGEEIGHVLGNQLKELADHMY